MKIINLEQNGIQTLGLKCIIDGKEYKGTLKPNDDSEDEQ